MAAFSQLGQLKAPDELDERVFPLASGAASISSEQPEPRWMDALEDLPQLQAPAVLDRLVDEELRQVAQARARRFAGGLERQAAPTALERRLFPLDERRPHALRRPRLLSYAAAAAAALTVWVGLNLSGDAGGPAEGPLAVQRSFAVHSGLPAKMHPLAASMADVRGVDIATLRAQAWAGGQR
ncbi:MAG: hypothetical protein AAF682_00975 [Planctomycetota bacterium]